MNIMNLQKSNMLNTFPKFIFPYIPYCENI